MADKKYHPMPKGTAPSGRTVLARGGKLLDAPEPTEANDRIPTPASARNEGDADRMPPKRAALAAPSTPGRDGRMHRVHCPRCGVDMRPLVRRDGAVQGAVCCGFRWRWVWNEFLPDGEA